MYGRQIWSSLQSWPHVTTYTGRHPRRIAGIGLPVKTQAEEEHADAEQAKTEDEQAEMEQAENLEVQTKTEEEQAEGEQTEKGSSSWPTPPGYTLEEQTQPEEEGEHAETALITGHRTEEEEQMEADWRWIHIWINMTTSALITGHRTEEEEQTGEQVEEEQAEAEQTKCGSAGTPTQPPRSGRALTAHRGSGMSGGVPDHLRPSQTGLPVIYIG